jgi:hypothetical protein
MIDIFSAHFSAALPHSRTLRTRLLRLCACIHPGARRETHSLEIPSRFAAGSERLSASRGPRLKSATAQRISSPPVAKRSAAILHSRPFLRPRSQHLQSLTRPSSQERLDLPAILELETGRCRKAAAMTSIRILPVALAVLAAYDAQRCGSRLTRRSHCSTRSCPGSQKCGPGGSILSSETG